MIRSTLALGLTAAALAGCAEDPLELCTGDYTVPELHNWFQDHAGSIASVDGVHGIGVSDRYGCIMVYISHGKVKPVVRVKARSVGVPADAIGFRISEPVTLLGPGA
ncbi:MAG: hypothetical protein WEA24_04885 [Gemmatimonadota bacterium]